MPCLARCVLFLSLIAGTSSVMTRTGERASINPIRRIVSMLQAMSAKITAEGEKEKEFFENFKCYCKNGAASLEKSIEDAEVKIPALESAINATSGELLQLKADVKAHKADKGAAKEAMAEGTGVRETEAAKFAKDSSDDKTNLAAMSKAIAALGKGMGGSFLQTQSADVLRRLLIHAENMDDASRDVLTSFLAQSSSDDDDYAPSSGQIVGILDQMKDTLAADLAQKEAAEKKSIEQYEALIAAKKKQTEALTRMIEEKLARIGEAGVEVVNMMNDLEETKAALVEDRKFFADLGTGCSAKEKEWEQRSKTRSEELIALSDTIKVLNDDDALELFKKTLPTPSLLQIDVTSQEISHQVQRILKSNNRRDYRIDLISLAVRGKKVSFDKIIGMIDDMGVLLNKEQQDDNNKKGDCETSLDESEDTMKELQHAIGDLEKTISDVEESISTLTEDIAALVQGIKDLDHQVSEATQTRKDEHSAYIEAMASDTAAVELLEIAKNRLNKFYNPKLFKPAPKRALTAEESIYSSMGGDLGTTPPPGGIANTGVAVLSQVAPPPPPETWSAYAKKSQESTGAISMLNLLIKDLTKEMQEMEFEEKEAEKDYATLLVEAKEKRANDSQTITEKEGVKADLEVKLHNDKEEKESTTAEAAATAKTMSELHAECDWLISNFEVRKEARADEMDTLKKAKAVLSGADYSFVQTSAHTNLRKLQRL